MEDDNNTADALINGLPLTIGDPEPDPEPDEKDLDPALVELQGQFTTLQEDMKRQSEQYQGTIDSLLAGVAAPSGDAAPKPINFDDLPDPVENMDEFKTTLAKRMSESHAAIVNAVTNSASQNQQANDMWTDFKIGYPDLAVKESLAHASASHVIKSHGAQGSQWARQNIVQFGDDVAKHMATELGIDEPKRGVAAVQNDAEQNNTANRTGGVKGGTSSNSQVVSKDTKSPGFIDMLKKQQMADGLI